MRKNKSQYRIYHNSYTSAVMEAILVAQKSFYDVDPEECAHIIGVMSNRPKVGETTRVSLPLLKDGKSVKPTLNFQVYCMGERYELNCYVW